MTEICVRIVEDSASLADMLVILMELNKIHYCVTTHDFEMLLGPELWEGVTTVLCDLDLGGPVTGEMILVYLQETHPWIKRVVLSAVAEISSERIISLAHEILAKPADLTAIARAVQ